VIVATAGHIDHGKTSLVKALTGTDADRLREEKQRGITIDLGFAYWPQPDGSSIGFVDVPGHEGYIHNMLAGVTGVNAVMLIIAVNDGIKPQTLEHLQIIQHLGIKHGLVALTKVDLADAAMIAERQKEIREILAATVLQDCAIIPVSIKAETGLDLLKTELSAIAVAFAKQAEVSAPAKLSVDRSFSLDGVGTIITGSLQSGQIKLDDKLVLSPSGREVRVRGIHAQNAQSIFARAGDRAAINLATLRRDEVARGDMLIAAELHYPTLRLDCSVTLGRDGTKPLAVWTPVHFHYGTGHWPARVVPLEQDKLLPGQTQLVQIVLEAPIAVFSGDRFVLRDASASRTIGGGVILDRRAGERNRRKPDRLKHLAALAGNSPVEAIPALLLLPPYAVDIRQYALDHGLMLAQFDPVIVRESLIALKHDNTVYLLDPATVLTLSRQVKEALRTHHERHPDQAGMTSERLRLALPHRLNASAFAAVVHHLEKRRDTASVGAWLRLPDHVPKLTAEHQALWARIKPRLLGEHRFKPPKIAELAEEFRLRPETIRGLMKRLARRGDVQEVIEDQFLESAALAELADIVIRLDTSASEGWFNAAMYRDQLGIGRKMAILILEFFDLKGLTIRKGDLRKIDPRKTAIFCQNQV
jgi:selenocysteine-specific elongation factor